MTGRWGMVVVVSMVWCLAAPPAQAADVRTETAREHYLLGDKLFKQEKYANALHEYEQAYLAKPDPSFLYNVAQCHRLLGNRAEALRFFHRYLDDAPFAPNREIVEKHIKELEAKPAQAPSKSVAAPPVVSAAPSAAPAAVAPVAQPRPAAPSAGPPPVASVAALSPAAPSAPAALVTAPPPAPSAPPAAPVQPLPAAPPSSLAAIPPATDGAAVVQITTGPSEPRPIYKRWWFWTGLGVVVLGGIVLALSINQQDPSCPAGRTCH